MMQELLENFGMCYRELARQLEWSCVILKYVITKSTSLILVVFPLRHNFLERLGTTCNSHDPSEGDVFQRQIRCGPIFNTEEEVYLNITFNLLGNLKKKIGKKKKEEALSRL